MILNDEFTENFEDLFNSAPCGYVTFDSAGLILNINATLLAWLGYDRNEVVGRMKFSEFIVVGERIFYETHFSPMLHMQGMAEEISFTLVSKTKQRRPVLTSTKKSQEANANFAVNRMSLFDISDRKKFEDELIREKVRAEAALRSRSDFLSMLSHEIRTPLTAVVGVAHMFDETKLSDEQKGFAEILKRSSENLMNLLNSILDLSKIESGILVLERREFNCRQIISDLVQGWQPKAAAKGVSVEMSMSEKVPTHLWGDPVKLGQIVNNLVGNAVKFTSAGEVKIIVSVAELDANKCSLIFEVKDSGIGISSEQIRLIFDEYKQADYETGMNFGGSGLGLSICKKLAEMFGTTIQVESEIGKGSIFRFDIKFDIADKKESVMQKDERNFNSLKGTFVLVADDSEDNLMLVRHYLKKWGIRSETASDGREAFDKINEHDFDLVFLDLHMPVMDGYATTLAIRQMSNSLKAKVPIVAFSASTKFAGADIIDTMPVDAILGKPFLPHDLFDKISAYARRPNMSSF